MGDVKISFVHEKKRLVMLRSIIKQYGKMLKCSTCDIDYHILDVREECFNVMDIPRLRYICPACNNVIVEAVIE